MVQTHKTLLVDSILELNNTDTLEGFASPGLAALFNGVPSDKISKGAIAGAAIIAALIIFLRFLLNWRCCTHVPARETSSLNSSGLVISIGYS